MINFTTFINGVEHRTIGIQNPGVLSVIVNEITRESSVELELGGLEIMPDGSKKIVAWKGSKLNVGDEVLIRIAAGGPPDAPESERVQTPDFERNEKAKYLEKLRRELSNNPDEQ